MKNDKIAFWIIGIILLLIVLTKLPILPQFAIIQTTTCYEGVTNFWNFDDNLLDSKGNLNAVNNGAIFVAGKYGKAIKFDTLNYISFPANNLTAYLWINNYSNPGWYYSSLPLTSTFGLGFNGSIDNIVVGTNASDLSGVQACYQTTVYENVTCQKYASSQMPDQTIGCLNVSGDFFPNCTYRWENQTTFKLENNVCKKNYYCSSGYSLSECTSLIQTPTTNAPVTTTSSVPTSEDTSLSGRFQKEIFNIGNYSITLVHLIIALIIIILLLYMFGVFGGTK